MPTKTWAQGEDVLAADFNTHVQKQVIATFATSTARDAAITTPSEGMACFLTGTGEFQIYRGALWRPPAGALVYSAMVLTNDINLSSNITADISPAVAQAVTFPYPTTVHASAMMYGGFATGPANFFFDMWSFSSGGVIVTCPSPLQASVSGLYVAGPLEYVQTVASGVSVGFKVRGGLSAGPNLHSSGYANIRVYAI